MTRPIKSADSSPIAPQSAAPAKKADTSRLARRKQNRAAAGKTDSPIESQGETPASALRSKKGEAPRGAELKANKGQGAAQPRQAKDIDSDQEPQAYLDAFDRENTHLDESPESPRKGTSGLKQSDAVGAPVAGKGARIGGNLSVHGSVASSSSSGSTKIGQGDPFETRQTPGPLPTGISMLGKEGPFKRVAKQRIEELTQRIKDNDETIVAAKKAGLNVSVLEMRRSGLVRQLEQQRKNLDEFGS